MKSKISIRNGSYRNSSVEIFRIIATFLVLISHFNEWFVGGMLVRLNEFDSYHIGQAIIQSASDTCVNCFLAITGWYGLRFKWKHVWTIWSVLVWVYVPFYLINTYLYGGFAIKGLLYEVVALDQESYYVQCYLMLLFLSPILNSFIERFGKRILFYSLAFWAIEIIFDWILDNKCLAFGNGFLMTHFILMYLLGQTAYLYKSEIHRYINVWRGLIIYFLGMILLTTIYIFISAHTAYAYSNPINIMMAFALFFVFERKQFHSPTIDWISSSTLTVYICHVNFPLMGFLIQMDRYSLYNYNYPTYLLLILCMINCVFFGAILYDKIRVLIFRNPGNIVCNWISRRVKHYSLYD